MDLKDCDSPLRGLLNSPVKRITPAVPVPDWKSFAGRPTSSPVSARGFVPSPLLIDSVNRQSCIQINSPLTSPDPNSLRSSVISCTTDATPNRPSTDTLLRLGDSSSGRPLNIPDAAFDSTSSASDISQPKHFSNTERLPQTPSQLSRISGDVTFTPTHSAFTPNLNAQNPHATMVAQTPIASGPTQAIHSIKLQNCVSTVNMCCELKLLDIYCRTRFSEYNPSRFHGVVMRILEPRATALVFRSGKLVCTGTKNEHDSLLAARKFSRIIQKLGNPVRFTEFKIQNFVATADLRFPVRLEALQQAHGQFTSYEPELFPGLIYRMVRPRIVLLIFVNGKIVFTGGKSRNDITEALNIIYPILRSFKKN